MRQSISLIARMPSIMSYAYQVKRRHFDRESMFFHPYEPGHCTAEAILNALRPDRKFTREEAKLLDLCMVLHAEHGGGQQLHLHHPGAHQRGHGHLLRHRGGGGVTERLQARRRQPPGPPDDGGRDGPRKRLGRRGGGLPLPGENPEPGGRDRSGLIYGMGHAIYTLSDPRAVILKSKAAALAREKGYDTKLALYQLVEKLSPQAFQRVTGNPKVISANVDFYSGLIYEMLGIPEDLYTPMFAVSRIAGWCAHRIEELTTGGRIMRPAYRALPVAQQYVPLDQRS